MDARITNIALILMVAMANLASQLLLKQGMMTAGPVSGIGMALRYAVTSPAVVGGLAMQGVGFSLWLYILTRTKLGYALGMVGAFFYLMLPLLTWWLFGERLAPLQWLGLAFVCLGVLCLGTRG